MFSIGKACQTARQHCSVRAGTGRIAGGSMHAGRCQQTCALACRCHAQGPSQQASKHGALTCSVFKVPQGKGRGGHAAADGFGIQGRDSAGAVVSTIEGVLHSHNIGLQKTPCRPVRLPAGCPDRAARTGQASQSASEDNKK